MNAEKITKVERFLNTIERVGNRLPDPVTIFLIIILILMVLSLFLSGVSAVNPMLPEGDPNRIIVIQNLFSQENLTKLLTQTVTKFQNFPPLGMVLMIMLGAGVAIKSGLMDTLMKVSIVKVPEKFVTTVVVLVSLLIDGAGDIGFIMLPPLAALIYASMGRNPLVGMFVAYAVVGIGFASDFFVNMTDVLFTGFTLKAATIIDEEYRATPAMNWYYMFVTNILILIATVYITEKVITPRMNKLSGIVEAGVNSVDITVTVQQKKGLKWAGIACLLMIITIVALCIGPNAFMKDPKTGSLLDWGSPLMQGMIPLMTLLFFIPGLIYGIITKSIRSDKDAVRLMSQSMGEMGGYLVIALMSAIFVALFSWSKMDIVLSILGADWIKGMGLSGISLLLALIVLTMVMGMFIGSASAKWAILAPIFVPMLMQLHYDPAVTQMAFRIGDAVVKPLTPLLVFFPMLLAYAKQYKPDIGMGTIIANMLPLTVASLVIFVVTLLIFIFFGIPLGPGTSIVYSM